MKNNRHQEKWTNPHTKVTPDDIATENHGSDLAEHVCTKHGCLAAFVVTFNRDGMAGISQVINGHEVKAALDEVRFIERVNDLIFELALPERLPTEFLAHVSRVCDNDGENDATDVWDEILVPDEGDTKD